jgi:hypothetical protein
MGPPALLIEEQDAGKRTTYVPHGRRATQRVHPELKWPRCDVHVEVTDDWRLLAEERASAGARRKRPRQDRATNAGNPGGGFSETELLHRIDDRLRVAARDGGCRY